MSLNIVTDPEFLAQVSQPVIPYEDISIILLEMQISNTGAGLAAVQVGHLKRIIMINTATTQITVVNPRIEWLGKAKKTSREGCLSFPGKIAVKVRHARILLTGVDAHGKPVRLKLKGLDSYVAQHEVDHLDGVVI